ncbi:MAG: ECF-type sigma factor [Acidobacteriota bacterium]
MGDLLQRSRLGDAEARDRAFSLVYVKLKQVAQRQMRRLSRGATLSTTVLVHEVYLRFADSSRLLVADESHLLCLCARAMRQVALDHVRKRQASKRSGPRPDTSISEALAQPGLDIEGEVTFLIQLDRALSKLEAVDRRLAQVAELRFFAGSSVTEVARALEISEPTVKRDTRLAKAMLQRELNQTASLG